MVNITFSFIQFIKFSIISTIFANSLAEIQFEMAKKQPDEFLFPMVSQNVATPFKGKIMENNLINFENSFSMLMQLRQKIKSLY